MNNQHAFSQKEDNKAFVSISSEAEYTRIVSLRRFLLRFGTASFLDTEGALGHLRPHEVGRKFMSKAPLFLDFSNIKFPKVDAWGVLTLPIRLLGRVAIESNPEAPTYHRAAEDVSNDAGSVSSRAE